MVYLYEMKGQDQPILGVKLLESDLWVLIRNVSHDYFFDGYLLVKKKYIIDRRRPKHLVELVLAKKHRFYPIDIPSISIDKNSHVYSYFHDNGYLVQLSEDDYQKCYIGRIVKFNKIDVVLESITPKFEWDEDLMFREDEIRTISWENDYIKTIDMFITEK